MKKKLCLMLSGIFILTGCAQFNEPKPAVESDTQAQNISAFDVQKRENNGSMDENKVKVPLVETPDAVVTEAQRAIPAEGMTGDNDVLPAQTENTSTNNTDEVVTYKVEIGDSLYSIARKNRISIVCLAKANKITDPNRLAAGQTLVIPKVRDC